MRKPVPAPSGKVVHADHTVITPPATLRLKAWRKANSAYDPEAEMARAQQALAALEASFTEWMGNEVLRLFEGLARFEASSQDAEASKAFFIIVHDIRGQAMQFGYPLAARLAASLCEILEHRDAIRVPPVIVRRYVEAIASIVRTDVRDETNQTALELMRTLAAIVDEFRVGPAQAARA